MRLRYLLEDAAWQGLRHSRVDVGSARRDLPTGLALPDAHCLALHGELAAEGAHVAGVLAHLMLLDDLCTCNVAHVTYSG